MTNMELLELFGEARGNYVREAQLLRGGSAAKKTGFRKIWLLAAAVFTALALSLTAYAAISARIQMQLSHTEEPQPEEINTLCTVYPQKIPAGYELISGSIHSTNVRELYYWNEAGTEIAFALSVEQDVMDTPMNPGGEKVETVVCGQPAVSYRFGSSRWLLWKNDDYSAYLRTDDPGVDLSAMAESVTSGELLPENFLSRMPAGGSGLWYPQKMPDGYEIRMVEPVTYGIQSVDYARIGENRQVDNIHYAVSVARDLSSIAQAPYTTMTWEEVDVAGLPGRRVTIGDNQQILFWKNAAEGFNAMLMTEAMDEDLIAIAASVGPGLMPEVSPLYAGGTEYSVQMAQENTYVAFEPWYPQAIPEGYELEFVSDKAYGEQTVRYINAEGEMIRFTLYYRFGNWPRGYEGLVEPEAVDIRGSVGYLITDVASRMLLWVDEEKGFGFVLAADGEVDLLEIARSVAPGEELPATNAGKTAQALEKLGDYRLTSLPEGMQEDGVSGWIGEGDQAWLAYVRRWYVSHIDNRQIHMEYTAYRADPQNPTSMQELARMSTAADAQPTRIGGHVGAYSEYDGHAAVTWLIGDEEQGISFSLFSDDFSAAELIALAESVQ